jgi:TRAP-type C4-dicarboxylate transport system substrate-binding protein
MEPMANEIMKRSNGRVKIELFHGGALGKGGESAAMLESGTVDMGIFKHDHTPGRFPLSRGIDLPFIFASGMSGSATLWELYETTPAIRAEHKNMKVLGMYTYDPNQCHMVTKPVYTLDDMKGMVIRGTGPIMGRMISLFGATPTSIKVFELYSALERKVVDGTFFSLSGMVNFKLAEVVQHTTLVNAFVGSGVVAINQDVWDSLPPDIQKIFEEVSSEFKLAGGAKYDKTSKVGIQELKNNKREIIKLSDDEMAKWKDRVSIMYDEWANERETEGLPGKEVLDKLFKFGKKYNAMYSN